MATGQHYYQRVGTWDSVKNDRLGKVIYDPIAGRTFQYMNIMASTAAKRVGMGSPVGHYRLTGGASSYLVTTKIASSRNNTFAGIVIIDGNLGVSANAKSTSGYAWVMTDGPLGRVASSEVFNNTIYALVSAAVASNDTLRWSGGAGSASKLVDNASHLLLNRVGIALSTDINVAALPAAYPLIKGWIDAT